MNTKKMTDLAAGLAWNAVPSRLPAFLIVILVFVTASADAGDRRGASNGDSHDMNVATEDTRTNKLIHATSPYLLQHAHNPVDWYEWGEEAFEKAKKEDKPVFLSIGYAACHWCHVMAHESFENEQVAEILNRHFVSIKVDREERPDIDEIYMAYTQMKTHHGGWPMSVWLEPDGTPFHAGTYFPKQQFIRFLTGVAEAWRDDRTKLTGNQAATKRFFDRWAGGDQPTASVLANDAVDAAGITIANYFDRTRGGISGGGTNKFPPSMAMELILRVHRRTGRSYLLDTVRLTLDHMARGGIYDHLGGGICRYSTDVEWLVPHFEKMMYDQGLVSSIYLDAYQITHDPLYAYIASDIFRYVMTDMQSPLGGFFSSRDADSGGLEGAFYIWTVEEVHQLLGEEDGKLFCLYYDVTPDGNWFEARGHAPSGPKNILRIQKPADEFARIHGLDLENFQRRLAEWREKLLAVRHKRVPPGLDDKVLTGWNGLIIASLAKGARVLDEPKFAQAASKAANFILMEMRKDGRLLRSYREGQAHLTAYLSDYAFFVEALLNLYEATFERRWLDEALALTETSIKYYYDEKNGAFFFTANDAEKLVARSKNPRDGAIPSGNSVQALNLLRLSVFFNRPDLREKAESIFQAFGEDVLQRPGAFERLMCAADFYFDTVKEIAFIGDPDAPDTKKLVRTLYDRYLPNKVVVGAPDFLEKTEIPLLVGKTRREGKATAYVCEGYRCKLPVTTADALVSQLENKP